MMPVRSMMQRIPDILLDYHKNTVFLNIAKILQLPMIRKITCLVAAIICTHSLLNAQARLIEKIPSKPNEVTIPYEMYKLKNGLTILVHEDHSDPLVHVDVTYHVGSARELPGKSGFAHFFEHMMFQGSKHVGDDQHFKIISNAGGTLNGTTNRDRTNYYETIPKNQLEVALWLEADRMGFLLDSVTQEKFEVQRGTVKNERGQNYDNRPYGLVSENISRAFYPKGHPYSWLTIGYIDHLNAVSVNDLKAFFLRWYGPNNAVITIGGDVNTAETVKLVEKYFGSIKPCPKVEKQNIPQPVLNENRYISMADNIRQPLLRRVYPSVPAMHGDEAALDLLCTILSGNKSSIFYNRFIKSQMASNASVYNSGSELSGELTINVMAYPGINLSSVDSLITACLDEFERNGPSDEDLQKAKMGNESSTIRSLESVNNKVSTLAYYYTFGGNANLVQKQLQEAEQVTKMDIMRVFNLYFKNRHYVAMSVYPKDKKNVAREDNYQIPSPDAPSTQGLAKKVKLRKAKDSFNRSKQPQVVMESLIPPHFDEMRGEFRNGIRFIGLNQNEIPYVSIQITIKGGHQMEFNNPEKAGIAQLTARLMNEGTASLLSEQFESELDKIGSTISVSSDDENTYIFVGSLKKYIDVTLGLLQEKLLYPAFRQAEFDRAKKQQLESIKNIQIQPSSIADRCYLRVLFGDHSIRGVPNEGTTTTVNNITLDDVKEFYKTYYAPQFTQIVAVGDIEMGLLLSKLSFMEQWKRSNVELPDPGRIKLAAKPSTTTIYFVNSDKAAQSQIRMGYLALPYDAHGMYYKAGIMNFLLGGTFNSRLNMNLRENKAWTYGVRSSFRGTRNKGPFTISGGFKKETTDSTIMEIVKEVKNYRENLISDDEMQFVKNSILQSEALRYETLSQKAGALSVKLTYNLDPEYKVVQQAMLMSMTPVELRSVAQQLLELNQMSIIVVGDKKLLWDRIRRLGYPVMELDTEGNVLATYPNDGSDGR